MPDHILFYEQVGDDRALIICANGKLTLGVLTTNGGFNVDLSIAHAQKIRDELDSWLAHYES